MIKPNIKQIAEKNGITTAYQLQKLLGIQPSLAAKWYKNDLKMIGFDSLNTLCKAFNCSPSDLVIYTPDAANDTQSSNTTVDNTNSSNVMLNNSLQSITALSNASDNEPLKSVVREKTAKTKPPVLPELPNGDKWLKTAEIAERLGLSKKSVTDYINKGILTSWQAADGTPHYVQESNYPAFEAYYRNLTGKSKPEFVENLP
jgi:DNA-binding Xre family transcriptional regulator